MKIGIDCRIFSSKFTGIGRYTNELTDHLIELNNQLPTPHQIVLFFNNPEYREYKTPLNTQKVLVNAKHYSFQEQTTFLFKLLKEKCDIVHFPHFNVPLFYRKPYTVTIHDLTLTLFPGQKMNKWYHRLAYNWTIKNATRRAKKIIAVSNNTKNDLTEILHTPAKKIETIYHGLNPAFTIISQQNKLQKTLKKHKITKEFLLYTGVWRSHKNLPRLIRAFHALRTDHNLDLQLVITGKPDPHYPEGKNTIKELHLESDIILPGLIPENELVHLYNSAKIFTFPSLYEGFGFPPLEAMSCGTPVAASNSSSIPEVCGLDNATYFTACNTDDITQTILNLYKDIDLQAHLIEKGLNHCKSFSWKLMARKTFDIITKGV